VAQGYRVLVSSYACEPGRGSEPGVGWNWVCQIARHNPTWILTRRNNQARIEQALEKDPLPNAHFIYFDLPRWARWWKKGARGLHLYYYLWQIAASFEARRLHRKVDFQITHHVTFVTYWMPSCLSFLPIPFVWGPVGGGESTPANFRASFSLRGRLYEGIRDVVQFIARQDPLLRWTARRSTLALAATSDTAARLQQLGCRNVQVYSSMGLPAHEIQVVDDLQHSSGTPFRFVEIGDLLHLKGCDLALKAFARVSHDLPSAELWFIGEGPERRRLEDLATQLQVRDRVTFWGQLPRKITLQKLGECDVLVHPGLHDSGGCVCTEALAAGRPVICLDLGGPALQVTPESGIKIPAVTPAQVVKDLAAAMKDLALFPARRASMSRAARLHVLECLAWDVKGEQLVAMYRSVVKSPRAIEGVRSVAQYE
jgi:glycosyltransferase involved in cell wall biosynthesis